MRSGIPKGPKFIIAAALVAYVIALAVAWQQGTARANKRTETMLNAAETGYSDVVNGEIEAALRNVGGAIVNVVGGKCVSLPSARMRELAATFNLDEINVVDRRGVVIASNIDAVMGFDFNSNETTRAFMALTNATTTMVSHPFRPGVANPEMVCQYYGMSFPGHDGFLQLGVTVERLRQNMYTYTEAEADRILRDWHFSVVGWYERADRVPDFTPGKTFLRWEAEIGENVIGRYFDYKGYRYAALLPYSYCYSQRNAAFAVTALVITVLIAFFTFILVRLSLTSGKLEAMHAQEDARAASDLALARTIQMSALPSSDGAFLEFLEFSLYADSVPAREVGGDFYDFFHLPGGRLAFLIADVSGKGIPGAMFMMEAKNILKNCLVEFADLAEAVQNANARMCASNRAELFVTAWIGALDLGTGTFEYVNAGHSRPFIRRVDRTVEKVMGKGGRFLGMFPDAKYVARSLALAPGDALFLYTDGVTEAMNVAKEQFGEGRLREALAAERVAVSEAVSAFVNGAEPSDDMTGMMVWWHGRPQAEERSFACADESLSPAVEFIRSVLAGQASRTVAAVLNAADEVVSNIVNYSSAADFRIAVSVVPDRIRLRFHDAGKPYNPLSHVDPDTHAKIADRPVGGLGLVMVKRLADRVTYSRENGENVLTVLKRR